MAFDPDAQEMAGAALSASRRRVSLSNIGTKIRTGAAGAFNNATPKTWHHWETVETAFDEVRIIFGNASTTQTYDIGVCKIGVAGNPLTDKLMNSIGYVTPTFNTMGTTVAVAPRFASMRYHFSDWLKISSIPRVDGSKPVIAARVYIPTAQNLTLVGASSYDMTNWATHNRGRNWSCFYQDGDQATTPAGFTSLTQRSQTPILGFQYKARGRVVTVMSHGDSIDWSPSTTYVSESYWSAACMDLSDEGIVPVEYANMAWPGTTSQTFADRLNDALVAGIVPSIATLPIGSPNDMTNAAITTGQITTQRRALVQALGSLSSYGVPVLLRTILPTNPVAAVYDWNGTDSLRRAYNDDIRAYAAGGYDIVDADARIRDVLDADGQILLKVGTFDATLHPNQVGADLIRPAALAGLRARIGVPDGRIF
jgi:hypothetical protein